MIQLQINLDLGKMPIIKTSAKYKPIWNSLSNNEKIEWFFRIIQSCEKQITNLSPSTPMTVEEGDMIKFSNTPQKWNPDMSLLTHAKDLTNDTAPNNQY